MLYFVEKVLENLDGKIAYPDLWEVRLIRFDAE